MCAAIQVRDGTLNSTSRSFLAVSVCPGLLTITLQVLAEDVRLYHIRRIQPGAMNPSGPTPTTWTQRSFRRELAICGCSPRRDLRSSCAPKQCGGGVIAA